MVREVALNTVDMGRKRRLGNSPVPGGALLGVGGRKENDFASGTKVALLRLSSSDMYGSVPADSEGRTIAGGAFRRRIEPLG